MTSASRGGGVVKEFGRFIQKKTKNSGLHLWTAIKSRRYRRDGSYISKLENCQPSDTKTKFYCFKQLSIFFCF